MVVQSNDHIMLTFWLIGSQPASQLASCNWPANQACDMMLTCQALGWSDIWWQVDQEHDHIGPQSRVPALPLVPLGEWPTWPRPGKWHKWALQPFIYIWHYIKWWFAVLYLCCLITYSCTQCREMLYRLCSLQVNLHISFHYQCDVSLHQGTTFEELLLSLHLTEGKPDPNAIHMSCWPDIVLLLVTRCLYQGGMSEHRSVVSMLVPFMATSCLYQGGTSELRSVVCTLVQFLAKVRCIYISTILGSGQLYLC